MQFLRRRPVMLSLSTLFIVAILVTTLALQFRPGPAATKAHADTGACGQAGLSIVVLAKDIGGVIFEGDLTSFGGPITSATYTITWTNWDLGSALAVFGSVAGNGTPVVSFRTSTVAVGFGKVGASMLGIATLANGAVCSIEAGDGPVEVP